MTVTWSRARLDPGEAEEDAAADHRARRTRALDLRDPQGDVRQQGVEDEAPMKLTPSQRDGDVVAVRVGACT